MFDARPPRRTEAHMTTVEFITDFRGAELGEQREVGDDIASQWTDAGIAVLVAKQATEPPRNKQIKRPRSSKRTHSHADA